MDSETPDNSSQGPRVNQAVVDEKARRFEKSIQLKKLGWPAKLGLIAAAIAFVAIGYVKSSLWQKEDLAKASSDMDTESIKEREPAGEFDLIDEAGKKIAFNQYRGKVVLLTFWASWCTPCLVELPAFAQIEKKFGERGFAVVPVNVDEANIGKDFARDLWKKNSFTFASYFDPTRELAERFEIDILPGNFVIDRQGRIVLSSFGATDWNDPETVELIEALVNEK